MAHLCGDYAVDLLQGFFHSGLAVTAHHSFYFQCHIFTSFILRSGRTALFYEFLASQSVFSLPVMARVAHLKEIQAKGIGHYAEAGKAHGRSSEHGI